MRLAVVFLLALTALWGQSQTDAIYQTLEGLRADYQAKLVPVYEVRTPEPAPPSGQQSSGSYIRPCCAGLGLWSGYYVPRSWVYWNRWNYWGSGYRPWLYNGWAGYWGPGFRGFFGVSFRSHHGTRIGGGFHYRRR